MFLTITAALGLFYAFMAETIGGAALKLPGTSAKTEIKPSDILASMAPPPLVKGGTFVTGNGEIAAGTVVGIVTASGKFAPYADANVDGTETAVGVLLETIDTTDGDTLGNVIFSGTLKHGALTGLDAAAITDLNGRVINRGANDYFKF